MGKKKQAGRDEQGIFPNRSEREWWLDNVKALAGEHYLPDLIDPCWREGMTPRGTADKMKAK